VSWRKFSSQDLRNKEYNKTYLIDSIKIKKGKRHRENAKDRFKMIRERQAE
jgi:hypothetical protein